MNQILNVDNAAKKESKNKIKSGAPLEIQTIVKFFAIVILIFGICIIGTGAYGMYQGIDQGNTKSKPIMYVEQKSETQIFLKVTHDKELETVTYEWNNEGETKVNNNNNIKDVETTIEIPSGTNTLRIYAKDQKGQEIEYQKVYTLEPAININIEPEGNKLKVTAYGENQLQYMTYRWDEEDEIRIDIENSQVEEIVEIPRGLHTLTVIVVDINNKTETKKQEVNAVTKPKLEVTTDGESNFIIKASDEQGIKKIEFIIDEDKKYMLNVERELPIEERKEIEYPFPLHDGENKIQVTVYNESDITETFKALVNK